MRRWIPIFRPDSVLLTCKNYPIHTQYYKNVNIKNGFSYKLLNQKAFSRVTSFPVMHPLLEVTGPSQLTIRPLCLPLYRAKKKIPHQGGERQYESNKVRARTRTAPTGVQQTNRYHAAITLVSHRDSIWLHRINITTMGPMNSLLRRQHLNLDFIFLHVKVFQFSLF